MTRSKKKTADEQLAEHRAWLRELMLEAYRKAGIRARGRADEPSVTDAIVLGVLQYWAELDDEDTEAAYREGRGAT